MEANSMKANPIQRALAWLLPFVLAACATTGGAQSGPSREERAARLAKAEAMFAERCKTAGERIHHTVDNVDGIFLMKLRPEGINRGNQFSMDDPYGSDTGGDGYIKNFLFGRNDKGSIAHERLVSNGYRYVEAIDPKDGNRYRYTGRIEEPWQRDKNYLKGYTRFVLDKVPTASHGPRYGVTYDDISTREDREYWIAGSSLRVIDLKTNEVIAERIGYMMDRGQGNDSGDRAPWLLAAYSACPAFPMAPGNHPVQIQQTRKFVESVLHIDQEK
jgi:hypothetical protein